MIYCQLNRLRAWMLSGNTWMDPSRWKISRMPTEWPWSPRKTLAQKGQHGSEDTPTWQRLRSPTAHPTPSAAALGLLAYLSGMLGELEPAPSAGTPQNQVGRSGLTWPSTTVSGMLRSRCCGASMGPRRERC